VIEMDGHDVLLFIKRELDYKYCRRSTFKAVSMSLRYWTKSACARGLENSPMIIFKQIER
jgi:hypothetical protein